jgi:hypothetical protein
MITFYEYKLYRDDNRQSLQFQVKKKQLHEHSKLTIKVKIDLTT